MENTDNKDLEYKEDDPLFIGELPDLDSLYDELLKSEEPEVTQIPDTPAESEPANPKKEDKVDVQKTVLTYLHDLVFLVAGLIVVSLLLFRVVVVSGTSMNRTLLDGDYLLVLSNMFYHNPEYGDVIVASKDSFDNGAPIVKRVIATEGQTVDIDFNAGIVYVDGDVLEESYTYTPTNVQEGVTFPLVVEEGCIFVMGDNRNGSKDSRSPEIGLIDKREVMGKVFFLFLPGTNGTDIYGRPREDRDFSRIGVID